MIGLLFTAGQCLVIYQNIFAMQITDREFLCLRLQQLVAFLN